MMMGLILIEALIKDGNVFLYGASAGVTKPVDEDQKRS
jgi:hypothetical protein